MPRLPDANLLDCAECFACCHHVAPDLINGEVIEMLPNGNCPHLSVPGVNQDKTKHCNIYEHAPHSCQRFNCMEEWNPNDDIKEAAREAADRNP